MNPIDGPSPQKPSLPLRIKGAQDISPETLERLEKAAERAIDFFAANFGEVHRPLQLDVSDAQTSLRTGYNLETDQVNFPQSGDIINKGLDSEDIIHHEIFHALACQAYPQFAAQSEQAEHIHEALADYFAYLLHPDESFGENYRTDRAELRKYRTELCLSLSPGAHMRGNALTSHLLNSDTQPYQIREFLTRGDYSLDALGEVNPKLRERLELDSSFALKDAVENYPPSAIHRYRIEPDVPLKIRFEPNDPLLKSHPGLQVRWGNVKGLPSEHFTIRQGPTLNFEVSPKAADAVESEKLLALFYEGDRLLGSRPFYFSSNP